jgi:hypothetical protein
VLTKSEPAGCSGAGGGEGEARQTRRNRRPSQRRERARSSTASDRPAPRDRRGHARRHARSPLRAGRMARAHVHLVDTGGIEFDVDPNDAIAFGTRAQAENAARDADVIVFVVDARTGSTPSTTTSSRSAPHAPSGAARRQQGRIAERAAHAIGARRVRALGFGEPFAVSAIHGEGTGDLLDAIVERLPAEADLPEAADRTRARADRPAERRQVVAAQRDARRRTHDRLRRAGHDARFDRHAASAGARSHDDPADRHRGRAQTRRQTRRDRVLQLAAFAARDLALRHRDLAGRRDEGPQNADRRLAGIAIEENAKA